MTTYKIVKELLENEVACRNSDRILIWRVWVKQGLALNGSIGFHEFVNHAKTPESIRRTRQKLQQNYPHLRASEIIQAKRKAKQENWPSLFS